MRKSIYIILLILTACSHPQQEVVVSFPGIPQEQPELPIYAQLKEREFAHRVEVFYLGDSVHVSSLPAGVLVRRERANLTVHSTASGVEFVLAGSSNNGSFTLHSEKSALLSLSSLDMKSGKNSAISIVSPSVSYIRSLSGTTTIVDGEYDETLYIPKKSSTIRVEGSLVINNANVAFKSNRSSALICTGRLYIIDSNIAIEGTRIDGVVADSGVVASSSNIALNVTRDAFKSKKGAVAILKSNIAVNCNGEKGDGVQARNYYQFGGNVAIAVSGDVSRGINTKEAVYLMEGNLKIETSGNAIFSPKKFDYSAGSCIKSGTHTYIGRANVSLKNLSDGGKGINCNALLRMDGGTLLIENYGKGLQHPQEADAHSSSKGVKCDSTLVINGGIIDIRVFGEDERSEGLEAKHDMIFNGDAAKVNIFAYDDAINVGNNLIINGGYIYAYSVANDGIDSNGHITINGGVVLAIGSGSPEQGIDVDDFRRYNITGGIVVSVGGYMGSSPSMPYGDNNQPSIVWTGLELNRNKYVVVSHSDKDYMALYLPRTLADASLFFSSDCLKDGTDYTLFVTDSVLGGIYLGNGLYLDSEATASGEMSQAVAKIDYKADGNGFPPPPPGFDGKMPDGNGFPPPPPGFGGKMPDGNGFPPPPFKWKDKEGYNKNNLPGEGWR